MVNSVVLSDFPSLLDFLLPSVGALTVLHVNIRSIRKHWNEFQTIVGEVHGTVDVFVLTEINVRDVDISQDQFSLLGFEAFFFTRTQSRGGGIAIYVRDDWSTADIVVPFEHAECISLKLFNNTYGIALMAFYRPPSGNVLKFLDELNSNLSNMSPTDKLCLVGDFNIDLLKPAKSTVCDYLNILADYGLESIIQSATRE